VLHTLKGETVSIAAKDFRQILGNNIVRSTNFRATLRGSKIEFRGKGWGHGVGLCQWGHILWQSQGIPIGKYSLIIIRTQRLKISIPQIFADEIIRFQLPFTQRIDSAIPSKAARCLPFACCSTGARDY